MALLKFLAVLLPISSCAELLQITNKLKTTIAKQEHVLGFRK
jgi:hypothetical protein